MHRASNERHANAAPGTSAERSTQQSGAETFDACCLRRVCCSRIRAVQNVCVWLCVFFLDVSVNVSWLISPQHVKTLALDLKCCCTRKRQEKKRRIKVSLPRSAPSHTMRLYQSPQTIFDCRCFFSRSVSFALLVFFMLVFLPTTSLRDKSTWLEQECKSSQQEFFPDFSRTGIKSCWLSPC